jgi:hypothetical protein
MTIEALVEAPKVLIADDDEALLHTLSWIRPCFIPYRGFSRTRGTM